GGAHLFRRESGDGFNTLRKILPVGLQVVGARKPASHSDDGDGLKPPRFRRCTAVAPAHYEAFLLRFLVGLFFVGRFGALALLAVMWSGTSSPEFPRPRTCRVPIYNGPAS